MIFNFSKNYFSLTYCFIIIISLLFLGCDKSEEEIVPSFSINESTLPTYELPAEGGSITIEVNWTDTQLKLVAESATTGSDFIEKITPSYFGSKGEGPKVTKVTITFGKNGNYSNNTQVLRLSSLSDDLQEKTFNLSQTAKSIEPINLTLTPSTTYQTITGFGGANMIWGTDFLNTTDIQTVFGTGEDDLGLTIYRVRLSSVQSDWQSLVSTVQEAKNHGALILASPWSPPANLKSNNSTTGGHLLESNYGSYANYINDFVQYMNSQNAAVDAISVQNEPDIQVGYESCDWTSDQIYNFVKDYGAIIQGTDLLAAESFNFKHAYTDKILNDPIASANLDIVGGHIYGSDLTEYPLAEQKGKEIWMTEYLLNLNSGSDPDKWDESDEAIWNESMEMLETIHKGMISNWNAYIWWYIRRFYSFLGDGEHGTVRGEILKRGLAFSHFSKFVRPGYVRIDAQLDSSANIKVSAYTGDNKEVVVIINSENNFVPEFNLMTQSLSSAEIYVTSFSKDREKTILSPNNGSLKIGLDPKSITTIVIPL